MQFHLNGFRAGDPDAWDQPERPSESPSSEALAQEIDVLIVGCGPTGLTLATQLAAFPQIRTRIVDQKSGRLLIGQADGIACRTVEMFEAFGFSGRVLKEAYWINETSFWEPDPKHRGNIVRGRVIQDVEEGLSEFPHVILNQARVHDFYLDVMRHSPARLQPDYARNLIDLRVAAPVDEPADPTAHAVTATFERVDPLHRGQVESTRACFVVGCDGARSAVRRFLGRELRGDSANQAWGVMDVLAVSNFPDIRRKSVIQSASEGSVLIIPREGGYLVRLYVELDKLGENERVATRHLTVEHLIAAARRVLRPYTLEVKEVAWWSVYEIGQRLCDKFDDVPEPQVANRIPRVFIAGDACHTHSPKAGQGMNVSMQDSFNLGWKLASVLLGRCSPRILHTYSSERQAVAKELIEFDRKFAQMFGARPKESDDTVRDGVVPAEFQDYFVTHGRFTAGTATRYSTSIITGQATHQALARGYGVGTRFHSAPVLRVADAKRVHLGHTLRADGRWRLIAFADPESPASDRSRVRRLCEFLAESPSSPLGRYTPKGADVDSVIEVLAVFQQGHRDLAIDAMPALLLPRKGRYGLIDYEKIFSPDLKGRDDIFDRRGIDRSRGCVVLVRPDQYIAHVLPLDAFSELAAFFDGFMSGTSRS
jgi:phenol 2-monooxygenase (NADPH)